MNTLIETVMIWAAGYKPANVAGDHPEDREQVAKMGATVLFATAVALINWSIAGWTYANGGLGIRLMSVVMAALLGATIVLVFDRSFVYFFDTLPEIKGFKYLVFAVFRVLVIIAIGSITAQAVMPHIIGNDLKVTALHMIEQEEKQRGSELRAQFRIDGKETVVAAAIDELKALEKAEAVLPQDIQLQLSAAKRCWIDYNSRRHALIYSGYTHTDTRVTLAQKFAGCTDKEKSAEIRRGSYFSDIREQLRQARAKKQQLEADLQESTETIKAKIADAEKIEKDSLDARSSIVMWHLLKTNPGALFKWAVFSFVLLFCELLPLIQKFVSGRSAIGIRYANDSLLRKTEQAERFRQRQQDFKITSAVSLLSVKAVDDALASQELHAVFAKKFASYLAAIAPIEGVRAMMQTLKERSLDKKEFMACHPQYAAVISEAWSNAIKDTTAILTGSATASSAHFGKSG